MPEYYACCEHCHPEARPNRHIVPCADCGQRWSNPQSGGSES